MMLDKAYIIFCFIQNFDCNKENLILISTFQVRFLILPSVWKEIISDGGLYCFPNSEGLRS